MHTNPVCLSKTAQDRHWTEELLALSWQHHEARKMNCMTNQTQQTADLSILAAVRQGSETETTPVARIIHVVW